MGIGRRFSIQGKQTQRPNGVARSKPTRQTHSSAGTFILFHLVRPVYKTILTYSLPDVRVVVVLLVCFSRTHAHRDIGNPFYAKCKRSAQLCTVKLPLEEEAECSGLSAELRAFGQADLNRFGLPDTRRRYTQKYTTLYPHTHI